MKTIHLPSNPTLKVKALKPFIDDHVTVHLSDNSFSTGTLAAVDQHKITMKCSETADEFYIRISKLVSITIRSRGNWKANRKNTSRAKTERLQIRCTLEQRIAIEKAAGSSNTNLSDFIIKASLDIANAANLWCP